MTTFAQMKTSVASVIGDPANATFTSAVIGDLINAALAEIGRIAPSRFSEDLTPVVNSMEYYPRLIALGTSSPEVEINRVEIWDLSQSPPMPLRRVEPASGQYVNYSEAGWYMYDGTLSLPRWVPLFLKTHEATHKIRIWGYSPYKALALDADIVPLSNEREWALRAYCRVEALQRLLAERDLFTQWQTTANNSDVSPAALMNGLNIALDDWRRKAKAITVLREAP